MEFFNMHVMVVLHKTKDRLIGCCFNRFGTIIDKMKADEEHSSYENT